MSLQSGLEDRKQGVVVQTVNEHAEDQSDDMSSGGTCLLSLWSGLTNINRNFVV